MRINEKELLDIFEDHLFKIEYQNEGEKARGEEQESLDFLDLLFVIREVFDCYVIKWAKVNEKEEVHLIKEVVKQNQKRGGWTYYLRRLKTKNLDGLALLESVLYHSQQNTTQYWLTPFLQYLRGWPSFENAYRRLKCLDNILFSSLRDDKLLTQRTWECMDGPCLT